MLSIDGVCHIQIIYCIVLPLSPVLMFWLGSLRSLMQQFLEHSYTRIKSRTRIALKHIFCTLRKYLTLLAPLSQCILDLKVL